MNKDSGLQLLAGTLILSILAHAALFLIKFKQPADSGYQQGISLTLTPQQESSSSSVQPESQKIENQSQSTNSHDIRDSALPWKEEASDAFEDIKGNTQSRPNLDWIDKMFTSDNALPGSQIISQSNTEEIKDLLKSSPSTRSHFWAYLVKHLANNKYHDKQYPFSELKGQHIVVLELGFQPSGMLVKADVARSSGDGDLDAAAIRSAYAANPFSPPPSSDKAFGYNYLVQIIYAPRKEK